MRDLAPACRDVTRLQSRALDESLPLRKRVGLKCHLLFCVWCRRYGRQLRFLREALERGGNHLAEDSPYKLTSDARHQLKELLREGL